MGNDAISKNNLEIFGLSLSIEKKCPKRYIYNMKRSELFFAFLQVPLDAMMIILAFVLSYYVRADLGSIGFYDAGVNEYLKYALYLIPIWVLFFAMNGLYSIKNTTGLFHELYKITITSSTSILLFVMIIFLTKTFFFSRLILIFIWFISIVTIVVGRLILRLVQKSLLQAGLGVRNVLLIGNNVASREIAKDLSSVYSGFRIAGIIGESESLVKDLKVIGNLDNLKEVLKKYKIDEVILTDGSIVREKMVNIIELCADRKTGFRYVPDVFAIMSTNFKPGLIGAIPVLELKSIPLDGWGRILKRIFDVVFGSILLIFLMPVLTAIAIIVKLTSKGPVFYRHQRVGRDERIFDFYKFRSMYINKCDFKGGVHWSTKDDEKTRITPVGKFLRKTNLDELPQFLNIIKGDMSLVGPRPELPKLVKKFEEEIPEYFRRHRVKSGLTGWAQVNGLKGDTSIEERVRYDIYYIENWSLWFDFKIIIKTILLVIDEALHGKSEYRSRT